MSGADAETPVYALDIETTGLAWTTASVTSIAVYSPEVSAVFEDSDELRLLEAAVWFLGRLPAGRLVTWNGAVFDWPFLAGRAGTVGVEWPAMVADAAIRPKYEPQPGFDPVGYHPAVPAADGEHTHVDVAYLWREWAEANGVRWGLKPVARAVGLEVIEVDRTRMDALSVPDRMAYCLSDVVATYRLGMLRPATTRAVPACGGAGR